MTFWLFQINPDLNLWVKVNPHKSPFPIYLPCPESITGDTIASLLSGIFGNFVVVVVVVIAHPRQ